MSDSRYLRDTTFIALSKGKVSCGLAGTPNRSFQEHTLAEFWCKVREEPEKFDGITLFSSTCDFPEEENFPEDFCIREFLEAALRFKLPEENKED